MGRAKPAADAARDRCASCGAVAQISPRLTGQPREWALRACGWLSLQQDRDRPAVERRLMCPHCLVSPPPRAVDLLTAWGIPPDTFANLRPPAPKPRGDPEASARKGARVRKCSSCGRWLEESAGWTVRVGGQLHASASKLTVKERTHALWYCGSAGCQAQAKRIAAQKAHEAR